jgi:hypothetical protein
MSPSVMSSAYSVMQSYAPSERPGTNVNVLPASPSSKQISRSKTRKSMPASCRPAISKQIPSNVPQPKQASTSTHSTQANGNPKSKQMPRKSNAQYPPN